VDKKPRKTSRFLALTGIGLQMGATIFLFAYIGRTLDEKYPSNKKWFTMGLTIFGVALSLYSVLKQVNRINKQEEDEKNR